MAQMANGWHIMRIHLCPKKFKTFGMNPNIPLPPPPFFSLFFSPFLIDLPARLPSNEKTANLTHNLSSTLLESLSLDTSSYLGCLESISP